VARASSCAAGVKLLPVLYLMKHRRFGRTELQMPVFSCGGMRYQQAWGELEPSVIEPANQENIEATIHRALELGINHIETARGYGSSEMQLGWILPYIERERLIVQTKVGPSDDPQHFLDNFEKSYKLLGLEQLDLLSFHGINTPHNLDCVLRKNGCLEVARQLQREGRVRFIGFSTHGAADVITRACASGEFDYFNVHYYFVNPFNWPAIVEAKKQDMGVFIISPTDKGGQLQTPSDTMRQLCAPLSPIAFNDLWCLNHREIHTLSVGASRPSDFDEHAASLEHYDSIPPTIAPIEERIREQIARDFGPNWNANWSRDLPEFHQTPELVNVRDVLRLLTYGKSLDLFEWAKGRYNLLTGEDDWIPGAHVGALDDAGKWTRIEAELQHHPLAEQIPSRLREAHELFGGEERKRLSQGG